MKKIVTLLIIILPVHGSSGLFDRLKNFFGISTLNSPTYSTNGPNSFTQEENFITSVEIPPLDKELPFNRGKKHNTLQSTEFDNQTTEQNTSDIKFLSAEKTPLIHYDLPLNNGASRNTFISSESDQEAYDYFVKKVLGYDPDLGEKQLSFDPQKNYLSERITFIKQAIPEKIISTIQTLLPSLETITTLIPDAEQEVQKNPNKLSLKIFYEELNELVSLIHLLNQKKYEAPDFSKPEKAHLTLQYLENIKKILSIVNSHFLNNPNVRWVLAIAAGKKDPLAKYNVDGIKNAVLQNINILNDLVDLELFKVKLLTENYESYKNDLEKYNRNENKLSINPPRFIPKKVAGYYEKAWEVMQQESPSLIRDLHEIKRNLPQFREQIITNENQQREEITRDQKKKQIQEKMKEVIQTMNNEKPLPSYKAPLGALSLVPKKTADHAVQEHNKKRWNETKNLFKNPFSSIKNLFTKNKSESSIKTNFLSEFQSPPQNDLSDPELD